MNKLIFFYLFRIIYFNSADIVTWVPRTSFDLPANFKNGKLPCSQRTVVFGKSNDAGVILDTDVAVAGIILPIDGEITLDGGSVTFGAPADECSKEDVYFEMKTPLWLQANVWDSRKFSKATPDAERIPCYDDEVMVPDMHTALQFPDITQHITKFKLDNYDISDRIKTVAIVMQFTSGLPFVLNRFSSTGLVIEAPKECGKTGCPCQEFTEIDCSVKICPRTKCLGAIKPIGNCCDICGGALTFDIDDRFDLKDFNKTVSSIVASYNDDLVYHIGRLPGNKVQVVVVNRGEYNQNSVEVIYDIESATYKHGGAKTLASISGSPENLAGMGIKIALSMFFVVISVMGGIYLYYYKLPDIRYPLMVHNEGLFSRFSRRSDSVVSLTRRDSGVALSSNKGFRNPLYDSKRGRVQLDNAIAEHEE